MVTRLVGAWVVVGGACLGGPWRASGPRRVGTAAFSEATSSASFSTSTTAAVAELEHLRDRGCGDSYENPIGTIEKSPLTYVPRDDFFVGEDALVYSQVTTSSEATDVFETCFHRAGPRKRVRFAPGEAKAAIVTCGGVCPGLNTVVRELYLCLSRLYGVEKIVGVVNGYAGFRTWEEDAVRLDDDFVDNIHKKGGTVLRSSRGGHETDLICDALEKHDVNLVFLIGGDGTMKGPWRRPTRRPGELS